MKILTILANKDGSTEEKLEAVQALVTNVRKKYGNSDKTIEAVKVPTTNGHVSISLLTGDEKVAIADSTIRDIVAMTTSVVETEDGTMFDRVFEGYVAVNPVLTNLDQVSDSAY